MSPRLINDIWHPHLELKVTEVEGSLAEANILLRFDTLTEEQALDFINHYLLEPDVFEHQDTPQQYAAIAKDYYDYKSDEDETTQRLRELIQSCETDDNAGKNLLKLKDTIQNRLSEFDSLRELIQQSEIDRDPASINYVKGQIIQIVTSFTSNKPGVELHGLAIAPASQGEE